MASRQGGGDTAQQKPRIQLTDEERQVLKECRRASLLRGIPLAFGAWYIVHYYGRRVPPTSHFGRSWSFYSVAAFIGGLFAGVSSYKNKCFQRIMQLEHSTLKDQVIRMTESMAGQGSQGEHFSHQYDTPSQQEGQLGHRRKRRGLEDHTHRSGQDKDSRGTRPQEGSRRSFQEYPPNTPKPETDEQPSAFADHKASGLYGGFSPDEDGGLTSPSSGQHPGRTFDEIRAENRKRQQFEAKEYRQQDQRGKRWGEMEGQWGRDQKQVAGTGKDRPRERRNKYGDIIIDDEDE